MKRILLISYNHKGKYADAIQNSRLIEGLKDYYSIDVLYRGKNTSMSTDMISVSSLNLSILDRILYKLMPWLYPIFSLDKLCWSNKAFHFMKNRFKVYEYIIMTYEPFSLFRFLNKIKKNYSVKYFAIFYDPLAHNLFFPNLKLGRFLQKKVESNIIKNADKIFVNNLKYYDVMVNGLTAYKYKWKIKHIPLCGLPTKTLEKQGKQIKNMINLSNKYLIVHLGSIHGKRNLITLNKSISLLKNSIHSLSEKLTIIILGRCSDLELQRVKESGNSDIIVFKGYSSQEEAIKYLENANAFLLIDPMDPGNFSFPSKLCEYIQFNKPIICLANSDAPSSNFLRSIGLPSFDADKIDLLSTYIADLLDNKTSSCCIKNITCFEISTIASMYYKSFEDA